MILKPDNYSTEWKHILWQMLDFIQFKETLVPKHFELVEFFSQSHNAHAEMEAHFESEMQKKDELEITRKANIQIIEDLKVDTVKIKEETEEKKIHLSEK